MLFRLLSFVGVLNHWFMVQMRDKMERRDSNWINGGVRFSGFLSFFLPRDLSCLRG